MKALTIASAKPLIKYEEADYKALDVSEGISGAFSFIRIKAKEFVMHNGSVKLPIGNAISGVIVGAGPVSRVFYATKYLPNQDVKAPDCAACDGITPDDVYTKPISSKCAECPKSAWGSRITDDGKKAKACREYKRVVIFIKTEIDTTGKLYRLDIPTTSMVNLAQYGKFLQLLDSPCPVQAVCTKISFDPDCDYAKLVFDAVHYLNPKQWEEIKQTMKDTTINDLLTLTGSVDIVEDDETTEQEADTKTTVVKKTTEKKAAKKEILEEEIETNSLDKNDIEDVDDLDAILDDLED